MKKGQGIIPGLLFLFYGFSAGMQLATNTS